VAKKRKSKVSLQPQIEMGNMEPKPIEGNHIKIANEIEKMVKPAMLVSRLNHPVTVKYDKSIIRISPRGRVKIADESKIKSTLPSGLVIVKIK